MQKTTGIKTDLLSESIFDKNKNKIKETQYFYESEINKIANNIYPYRFVVSGIELLDTYVYMLYNTISYEYRLVSTKVKEFPNNSVNSETISTITKTYTIDKVSLPSTIQTTNSKNEVNKTKIYYKSDVNLTTPEYGSLSSGDLPRIATSEVLKTESLLNNNLLETKQVEFKVFGSNVLPSKIKTKKGENPVAVLEDRIIYDSYDSYGNPTLVHKKDGSKTRYYYNDKQQVYLKIENFEPQEIDDNLLPQSPCYYHSQYPLSMVTEYYYDPITNNLITIIDPKCDKITYNYDAFNRLLNVTDKNGNKLTENQYNYKQ